MRHLKRRMKPMAGPMPIRPRLPIGGLQLATSGAISKELADTTCPQKCRGDHHHHDDNDATVKATIDTSPLKQPPPKVVSHTTTNTNTTAVGVENMSLLTPLPVATTTTSEQQQQQQQQQQQGSFSHIMDLFKLEDIAEEMLIQSTEPMIFDDSIMTLVSTEREGSSTSNPKTTITSCTAPPASAALASPSPYHPPPEHVRSNHHNYNHNHSNPAMPSMIATAAPLAAAGAPLAAPAPAAVTTTTTTTVVDAHVLHRTVLLFPNDANLVQTALISGPPQAVVSPSLSPHHGFSYPLHMAICQGANLPVLQLLVQAGPQVLLQKDGPQGFTPLMLALTHLPNRPDVHQLLRKAWSLAASIPCDTNHDLPLHVACRNSTQRNCVDLIQALLQDHPAAVVHTNKGGLTPLNIVALQPITSPHRTKIYQSLQQVALLQQQPPHQQLSQSSSSVNNSRRQAGARAGTGHGILTAPC